MNIPQITSKLKELFSTHRIVFWNDPQGSFEDTLDDLQLDGVKVIRPDQQGQLRTKVTLELEEPETKFLVYAAQPQPAYEDDWLLDIRLYSYQFSADRASLLIDELGLENHKLRSHLDQRKKFVNSKSRIAALKAMVQRADTESDLDRKMLAIAVGNSHSDFSETVRELFKSIAESNEEPEYDSAKWQQIIKLELEPVFWKFIHDQFGYSEPQPNLKDLLLHLFVTDLAISLDNRPIPDSLKHFVIPNSSNIKVFMANWRDSYNKKHSYDILACKISEQLGIEEKIGDFQIEQLLRSETFLETEKVIARQLRDRVIETADTIDSSEIELTVKRRQEMHWANEILGTTEDVPRKQFHAVYLAIEYAAEFFELKNKYSNGFGFPDAKTLWEAYTREIYRFDQLYRLFCEQADIAESQGWDILKSLRDRIENAYCNWYLIELAMEWNKKVDCNNWKIEKITNQFNFHEMFVAPYAGKKSGRGTITSYVIISDAFRYESAEELKNKLNGKFRFTAELKSMLGVLPSYTALGMAALLPHEKLGFSENGDYAVDGLPCASLEQRSRILGRHGGVAVKANELLELKQDQGRELVRDKNVVYIYHNTVDAMGDTAATEDQTFHAVRKAIDELADIVRYIVNSLNGSQILITADHGFIYRHTKPNQADKTTLAEKVSNAIKSNKRYIIAADMPFDDDSYKGKLSMTAGIQSDDREFALPKGLNLFYFTGGARFFHGGMTLQEIAIPVVIAGRLKGDAAEKTRERKVGVQVLGSNHRITTDRYRFELLQTEAVSDRVKPRIVKIAVYEGENPVTNIETATFESKSDKMADRTRSVILVLQNRPYDKNKSYQLILRSAEDKVEIERLDIKIDRAFTSDF